MMAARVLVRMGLLLLGLLTSDVADARAAASSNRASSFIRRGDLETGAEWISLHETVEFLPSSSEFDMDMLPRTFGTGQLNQLSRQRKLEQDEYEDEDEQDDTTYQNRQDNPQYRVQPFVEGVSDYDEYQQAWRLLGFMIDCDDGSTDDDGGSGSQDDYDTGLGCARYVVWAAYVDLEYEGGGIGEYQYYDRKNEQWDDTACQYTGSDRCAKMDCHLEDTHFSLLGFFKHKYYDDWMEQLFKHEGYCIWTDEEYAFMSEARETWPGGCILSGTTQDNGDPIYYDLKPVSGGSITLALYTDERCIQEYQSRGKNDPITIENVIGNILVEGDGSGDGSQDYGEDYDFASEYSTLDASLAAWDSAFDIFKFCQPCVAHDLENYGYSGGNQGENYGKYTYGYDDDAYSYGGGGADYDCYDNADYTNVNQCMKFMAKTVMNTATFRDLTLATSQGTLVSKPLSGYRVLKKHRTGMFGTYLYLLCSTCLLIYGIIKFHKIRKEKNFAPNWDPRQPLVFA